MKRSNRTTKNYLCASFYSAVYVLEALDIMEEEDYKVDLVVSDVKMPEMDGPTLFAELRKTCPDIKFIFVSGYADDAFGHSLDPDADFVFLPKPYTLAQIAETVKENIA